MRDLRILWLTENYYPSGGGMAQSCDRIVRGLRGLGVTVDLLHFTRHTHSPRIETKINGRTISIPATDDPAHAFNLLWNLLEQDRYRDHLTHVVAFGGTAPLLCGPLFAAWLQIPLITLFRGNDFDAGIFSTRRSDIVRNAISSSAAVCVVSREKEWKVARLYPAVRTVWVPNGIDQEEWSLIPSDRSRGEAWREEHVPEGRLLLGMFGQIKQKKGGLFFLEALLASGHAEDVHLLFIGDLDDTIVGLLAEEHESLSFTTLPFTRRYDLLPYYSICDLLVIPSFYDGTPNVLMEGALLGVPFIASTAGGMGDFLVDDEHGFLFHPGDVDGCVEAIRRGVTQERSTLRKRGEAAASMARASFDHRVEAETYRTIFLETAAPLPSEQKNGTGQPSPVNQQSLNQQSLNQQSLNQQNAIGAAEQ